MTPQECFDALGHLVAATPGWTDEAADEYVAQLSTLADPKALDVACQTIARGWDQIFRPPLPVIFKAYDDARYSMRKAIDPARIHCNGDGWRRVEGQPDPVPCERCNPYLAKVWADPEKRDRYRRGEGLERLGVGVERVGGVRRPINGDPPVYCRAADDPPEDVRTVDQVHDVMWRNYAEQRKALGLKANRRHFDKITGRLKAT